MEITRSREIKRNLGIEEKLRAGYGIISPAGEGGV